MKIFTLFKKNASLLAICLSLSICSCTNNEEEIDVPEHNIYQDIEVSIMGKWLPGTRNVFNADSDMPVLHFRNEQVYYQTIAKLNEMSVEERDAYFKELGFDGAYLLWKQADDELDQIFDNEDTLQLDRLVDEYKIKYERLFSFNTINKYDVTPYFLFTDNELSLVGNIKGYVVIGNELRTPQNNTPTYELSETPIATRAAIAGKNKSDFIGFKKAVLSIVNRNYKSTLTVGRLVDGNSLAVLFNTIKQAALYTKKVNIDYSVDIALHSAKIYRSGWTKIVCPYGKEIFVLDLTIDAIGNTFDADVDYFKCSVGPKTGRKLFKNIQVI